MKVFIAILCFVILITFLSYNYSSHRNRVDVVVLVDGFPCMVYNGVEVIRNDSILTEIKAGSKSIIVVKGCDVEIKITK